jgi:hypothetical protein
MTDKQSEALRLADALDLYLSAEWVHGITLKHISDELRRLHEVNAEMLNALYAVELWLSSGEGTGFQDKVLAAINKAEGRG